MGDGPAVVAPSLARFVLSAIAMCGAAAALGSCSKKHEEPVSRPEAYVPSPPPADASVDDAAVLRQWRKPLNSEGCETASKHANLVFGRGETDPKGAILLSRCLQLGNLAWYDCVMAAKAPAEISACSRKYFEPPPAY